MSTPNGYNNPAYCHQYDSSLYDYQYVPEIDPDSPDLSDESNRRSHQTKLVPSTFGDLQSDFLESDSFEGSDESNRSIIIEECNNRRVTLICEKRSKPETNKDEFYEDGNCRGAYYQDISLESEKYCDNRSSAPPSEYDRRNEERSLRHLRPLEPPKQSDVHSYSGFDDGGRERDSSLSFKQPTTSYTTHHRPQRYHRYEEIPSEGDFNRNIPSSSTSVHRYAEISSDENGYPTLTREIKVEGNREPYPKNNYQSHTVSKPRAISPINYPQSFSLPVTPSRTYQRVPYSKDTESSCVPQLSPKSTSPFIYSSSPVKTNSFEMAELSPPRLTQTLQYAGNDQTFFINSPKRQPPIGASASTEHQEPYLLKERCILPKNLQQTNTKSKNRSHSLPATPKRKKEVTQTGSSTNTAQSDRKITQIFHLKPVKSSDSKFKLRASEGLSKKENHPVRRNISNSFTECPKEYSMSPKLMPRSPYKPTTAEIIPPKTAIITPIFQRKNQQQQQEQQEGGFSPRRNFEKMSQAFQSTGNIFRSTKEGFHGNEVNFPTEEEVKKMTRIKRNQSVPNFTQTLAAESIIMAKRGYDVYHQEKYSRNLDLQYSPKKPAEHVTSIHKSKISLMDQTRSSWSVADSELQPQCSACFILAAIIHLVSATATCAISFYLLSRIGRRYFLDFGLLAGFVNFILGLLGFRSYCWKWIPNRNYISGFIVLAAFSALSCAGLTYLIMARPMSGDPILDILGGAICAISIVTISLALTGLTMSGCCKAPPPDNRVTDI